MRFSVYKTGFDSLERFTSVERVVIGAMAGATLTEMKVIAGLYAQVTDAFQARSRPKWRTALTRRQSGVEGIYATKSTPFVWLDMGTKRRYATMNPGYQPKTVVGRLKTYGFGGTVKYVKKKGVKAATARRKRIKARSFSPTIARQRRRPNAYARTLNDQVRLALAREFGFAFLPGFTAVQWKKVR